MLKVSNHNSYLGKEDKDPERGFKVIYKRNTNFSFEFSDLSPEERLYEACRSVDIKDVDFVLSSNKFINILYKDGIFFSFAISKNSVPMLKSLLEYAATNKPDDENDGMQFDYKFKKVLSEALEQNHASKEIEEIIYPYLEDFGNDSDEEELDYDYAIALVNHAYSNLYSRYKELRKVLLEENDQMSLPEISEHVESSNVSSIKDECQRLELELSELKEQFSVSYQVMIQRFIDEISFFLENDLVRDVFEDDIQGIHSLCMDINGFFGDNMFQDKEDHVLDCTGKNPEIFE